MFYRATRVSNIDTSDVDGKRVKGRALADFACETEFLHKIERFFLPTFLLCNRFYLSAKKYFISMPGQLMFGSLRIQTHGSSMLLYVRRDHEDC